MKKVYLILLVIFIIAISGYLYVRFSVLKTKETKPEISKKKSALDLRPLIIAKLQELVKAGSNGLYNLNIDKIQPHVILSKLDMQNVTLTPDTAALHTLDKAHKAPDDIFKISFKALHMDGIGIDDLLHKDEINLKSILITDPVIELYHTKRTYNALKRKEADSETLYQRLMKHMKKISVDRITMQNGTFITHNISKKNKTTRYNYVSININSLLVDSTTQNDKSRFFFAKQAELSCKKLSFPTTDSLYLLKIASIAISGTKRDLTATNVEFVTRGNKEQFKRKIKTMKEMYDIKIPKVILSDIDWWSLTNGESFIAREGEINNAVIDIFLDRSMPKRIAKINNFPHQILMRLPVPVSVSKMKLNHINLSYREYNPTLNKNGAVYIDDINGDIKNITNIPQQIKQQPKAILTGSALFMHTVSMTAGIQFDLANYKTGKFSADVHMREMDSILLNPVTEPMGEFKIKSGSMQDGIAHVDGNNYNAKGKGIVLYKDLYIIPLKKSDKKPGGVKKKTFTSFFANLFLIKNANPLKGKAARNPDFTYARKSYTTFFNLIWKTILTGILKTIGIPVKFADK